MEALKDKFYKDIESDTRYDDDNLAAIRKALKATTAKENRRDSLEGPKIKGSIEELPIILPSYDFDESTIFAVYKFIKKFVEATPNNNNIDRKIEEALDAVKTHLMVAVHKEVDFLKSRVSALEGRVNELETENSVLRFNYLLLKS